MFVVSDTLYRRNLYRRTLEDERGVTLKRPIHRTVISKPLSDFRAMCASDLCDFQFLSRSRRSRCRIQIPDNGSRLKVALICTLNSIVRETHTRCCETIATGLDVGQVLIQARSFCLLSSRVVSRVCFSPAHMHWRRRQEIYQCLANLSFGSRRSTDTSNLTERTIIVDCRDNYELQEVASTDSQRHP